MIKSQRDDLLTAEAQGRVHVVSRLPHIHQEQLLQLDARQAEEVASTHKHIQQLLDQKVRLTGDYYVIIIIITLLGVPVRGVSWSDAVAEYHSLGNMLNDGNAGKGLG